MDASRTTNYNRPPPPPRDDGGPRPMDLDYIGESRNRKSSKEGCYNCGRLGHFSQDCKQKGSSTLKNIEEDTASNNNLEL
ncbi:7784_t:CDS:2, partial [Entrophospora sp. SA101]